MSRAARFLYFAFGSNMDQVQMQARCPGAVRVGPAVLLDHAIAFSGWSARWGGAVATYGAKRGGKLPGVLWKLTARDVLALDGYEGAPHVYKRAFVKVIDDDGTEQSALTYQMVRRDDGAPPSFAYLEQIARAYLREGFAITKLMKEAHHAGLCLR